MKDIKTLLHEWKKYEKILLTEEADPGDVNPARFPKELSKVSPKASKIITRTGTKDGDPSDDVIKVTDNDEIAAVKNLIPSQSSMNIEKAVKFTIGMLSDKAPDFNPGGNLGAFISKGPGGLYIMDGHHRWIATGMINPELKMGGSLVHFPPEPLVAILNAITKGRLNIQKGKPGKGSFTAFNEAGIKPKLQKLAMDGDGRTHTGPEVVAVLEKWTGVQGAEAAVDAAAKKMGSNVQQLTLKAPSWAPERPDMPVIDKDQVAQAIDIAKKALRGGEIDVNPPYAETGLKFMDSGAGKSGSRFRKKGSKLQPQQVGTKDDEKRRRAQDPELARQDAEKAAKKAAALAENLDVDALASKLAETIIRSLKK
tara:strand:+ start:128 stop:1231 length:1104 start_codon:yes stop_codon:yes gene_type:complete